MLNRSRDIGFDNTFMTNVFKKNLKWNKKIMIILTLMHPLIFSELDTFIRKLKYNKATAIDQILNEVIKQNDVMILLHSLFNKFFSSSLLPSVWLKAVITPVPKSSSKDLYIPLNYRGISLLSCVSKVFTGIINNHIVCYCDENVYEYEQNDICKKRSCEDHIFTLTSILRNRMTEGKDIFCAFIDMQNVFDWVDWDLMFYRLLKYNITGNIYYCIKALYSIPNII